MVLCKEEYGIELETLEALGHVQALVTLVSDILPEQVKQIGEGEMLS